MYLAKLLEAAQRSLALALRHMFTKNVAKLAEPWDEDCTLIISSTAKRYDKGLVGPRAVP